MNVIKPCKSGAVFILGIMAAIAAADTAKTSRWVVETQQREVEFLAIGKPSALRIRGKTNELTDSLAIQGSQMTGKASLTLDKLETGIALRDRHMKEKYLETAKWPLAEFTLEKMSLPEGLSGEKLPFKGRLSLHGVTKQVEGLANLERKDNNVEMKFELKLMLSDYGITTPTYLGITVAEEVSATVMLKGVLKPGN